MKYYVIADVHGFFTPMMEALKSKGYFEDVSPHKLIVCGDLFDRGREAKAVQGFILDLLKNDEVILIRGNHEDLALEMLSGSPQELCGLPALMNSKHYHNGTVRAFCELTNSYLPSDMDDAKAFIQAGMNTPFVKEIIPAMRDYYETDHYIFVHGWIPCYGDMLSGMGRFTYNPDWRKASEGGWAKSRWVNGMEAHRQKVKESDKTIVCGHWNASFGHSKIEGRGSEYEKDADHTPYIADGIIALDACTVLSGFVNCVVVED